jgi:hypothetical protein
MTASPKQIPEATLHFETLRLPRSETLVYFADQIGARLSLPDGLKQRERDRVMSEGSHSLSQVDLASLKPSWAAEIGSPPFWKWVYSHDIIDEVRVRISS